MEFISFFKKLELFKSKENLKKLRDSGISIANDLCEEDRRKQSILVKHLKKARANSIPARIRGFRLEINGVSHTANELEDADSEYDTDNEGNDFSDVSSKKDSTSVSMQTGSFPHGSGSKLKHGNKGGKRKKSKSPNATSYKTRAQKKTKRN